MNIVIVDDEKSCVKALADKLNEYDDTNLVGVAYNGMDGLKLMSEQTPDLMFLDIELPDISGIEFLGLSGNLVGISINLCKSIQ
uniref:LytR/AlgR family response regulator transcription factor n=1 Tax=Prevotella sp. TaxID=59823 RepID=UPI00402A3380